MQGKNIHNIRIRERVRLVTPRDLKEEFCVSAGGLDLVWEGREIIQRILAKEDKRLLVVVGPCSVHDPKAGLEYAERLARLRVELRDKLEIVMRVYFEKPRTTIGWKGLINDPHLDGSHDIEAGLKIARGLMLKINELGLPIATEFLDPIIPQYIADLVSWAAVGARTTESQTHRQMASGLSMPVGFKNGTDGDIQVAVDAMKAAGGEHSFVGMDQQGITSIFRTLGNPWGHVVLRGGRKQTNYDKESIAKTVDVLEKAGLTPALIVDCSHANSEKKHTRQEFVWHSILKQRAEGNENLIGAMLESNLHEGNQPIPEDLSQLKYGVSITDACIDWEMTERLLREAAE